MTTPREVVMMDERPADIYQLINLFDFDTGSLEKVDAVGDTVFVAVHYPLDTGLNNKFSTFKAGRSSDIKRCS